MSPILDRIVRERLWTSGSRDLTKIQWRQGNKSWTSDPGAGKGPGQAQSAGCSLELAHLNLISSLELKDYSWGSCGSAHLSMAEHFGPDQCGWVGAVTRRLLDHTDGPCETMGPSWRTIGPGTWERFQQSVFDGRNRQGGSYGRLPCGKKKGRSCRRLLLPLEPIRPWAVTGS
ncbi:hypothetical protein DY000_02012772 [Brassica cretica]|uniref:Uncharacterized protein n=1 Tax=Brassica cretica TaxID=69181 RepID=A0ABQ7D8U3_BRACR|nr:hypothetical protein DY000_02012772 [Brassica cretica]